MSGSVNRVMIIGNLGADPDVRTTASGQLVCTLSIATSESFTDKAGVRQERTEWHRVVLWGKSAELAQRYLAKGRKVYIEGRLTTRKWQDKDGHDRYSTEVVANQMVFLDSGDRGGAGQGGGREQGGRGGSAQQQSAPPASPPPAGADPEFFDEDVPF